MTELVVHAGFDLSEEDVPTVRGPPPLVMPAAPGGRGPRSAPVPAPMPTPPVHRTVYLEAPTATSIPRDPDGRHSVGLAATFLFTFTGTTVAVLAAWASLSQRPIAEALAAPLAPVEIAAAPISAEEGLSATPPPPPDVPVEVPGRILDGTYVGTIADASGDLPVTFSFTFRRDGEVQATIRRDDVEEAETTGIYGFSGDSANFELIDDAGEMTRVYTGTIDPSGVRGEVTRSSGDVIPFLAER